MGLDFTYTITLGETIAIVLCALVGIPLLALGIWKLSEIATKLFEGGKVGILPPTPKDESVTEAVEEEENGTELRSDKCHNNLISVVILGAIIVGFVYLIFRNG